jgi:hypothetical protein
MKDLITSEKIRQGVTRLMTAPIDLAKCGAPVWRKPVGQSYASEYRLLFETYERQIGAAADEAQKWWESTIDARVDANCDLEAAASEAWYSRPAGPASYPGLVRVIRSNWLTCANLNRRTGPDQGVPPEILLLGWLDDGKHAKEVKVLSCMPYWPIGLTRDGQWL